MGEGERAGTPRRLVMGILALAAAYCVSGKLGLLLTLPSGYAAAIWPASGIALAALLCWGRAMWPGVALGSFLVNVSSQIDFGGDDVPRKLLVVAAIASGAAAQAVIGAVLVRRVVGFPTRLDEDRTVGKFLVVAGPVASTVSATVGVTALWSDGRITAGQLPVEWWTWWTGDALGAITFAPLILMWAVPEEVWRRRRRSVALPLAAAFALVAVLFVRTSHSEQVRAEGLLRAQVESVAVGIERRLAHHVEVLESVGDFCRALAPIDRAPLRSFVAGALTRNPDLAAIDFVSAPPDRQVGETAFDTTAPPFREAFREAATRRAPVLVGNVAVAPRIPAAAGHALVLPLFRDGRLLGFVIAGFRVAAVVEKTLVTGRERGLSFSVVAAHGARERVLHGTAALASRPRARLLDTPADVSGDRWALRYPNVLPHAVDDQRWQAVLAAGLLFVVFLEAFLLVVTGRATRVELLVAQRTHELEASNRAVEEQRSELARSNDDLAQALRGKEVLLRELQHRVKNNLQVIASLFSLQARYLRDPLYREIFEDSRNRVVSIALVHEKLYRSKDLSRIDFSEYARNLVSHLEARFAAGSQVALETDIEPMTLPVDLAIPCGLIINELVTNAFKHAFPGGRKGTVRVALREAAQEKWSVTVEDDGIGLPATVDVGRTESLGLDLVSILAAQIGAKISVGRTGGTRFDLVFAGGAK